MWIYIIIYPLIKTQESEMEVTNNYTLFELQETLSIFGAFTKHIGSGQLS